MQTFTIQEIYNTIHLENPTTGIKFLQYQKKKMYEIIGKLCCTNGNYTIRIKSYTIQMAFTDTN